MSTGPGRRQVLAPGAVMLLSFERPGVRPGYPASREPGAGAEPSRRSLKTAQ